MSNSQTIDIHEKIQSKNDITATEIRGMRKKFSLPMIDIIGTIGAGKTSILEYLAKTYENKKRFLVINGDLATSIDAERIGRYGAKCIQINTGKSCHLNAFQVEKVMKSVNLGEFDFIFVENVGNLICPISTDVGADFKIAVTSITEGPYVYEKHPVTFKTTQMAVLNKIDLAEAMELNVDDLLERAATFYPEVDFLRVSAKTGLGMDELANKIGLSD